MPTSCATMFFNSVTFALVCLTRSLNTLDVPMSFDPNSNKSLPKPADGPLMVHIGFYIESLGNFRAVEMSFDIDMYFRVSWINPTMRHNHTARVLQDRSELKTMWMPDLYFTNARVANFQTVTVPNFALYIAPNGTTAYSTRVTMQVACNLELRRYPMDDQICKIKIGSYTYPEDLMQVRWFSDNPLILNPEIDLPELYITKLEFDYCDGTHNYSKTEFGFIQGRFSCLLGLIYLKRSIGYHLVQTYFPTTLIVTISWVSFWIERNAVPARVTLSFTTLLTLATQGAGMRFDLPPVSYAKAIDFWYGTCMLFVFAGLLEFAIVNSLMRKSTRYQEMADGKRRNRSFASKDGMARKHTFCSEAVDMSEAMTERIITVNMFLKTSEEYSLKALRVDKVSRATFPLLFVIFCIVYCLVYSPQSIFFN